MRQYTIRTESVEETKKVYDVLTEHGVKITCDMPGLICYRSIAFECEKSKWKEIKKELGLKVVDTIAKFEE